MYQPILFYSRVSGQDHEKIGECGGGWLSEMFCSWLKGLRSVLLSKVHRYLAVEEKPGTGNLQWKAKPGAVLRLAKLNWAHEHQSFVTNLCITAGIFISAESYP
jgi:hypothetical protein